MNRLATATSPYLLQHKDNPVAWWPWGPDAFAEAQRTGRPVLLSVGYAACHWCHVMAHESFEDPAIAALMNEHFINIKVDREERPDVDQVYMAALHALGQQGGWPLTMFLTPEGEPVWGGTYFPPQPRFGRPSFPEVLRAVAETFRSAPDRIRHNSEALLSHLRGLKPPAGRASFGPAELDDAARRIVKIMDLQHGGIGGAPKFPNAPVLELLWRGFGRSGDAMLGEAVLMALRQMARGGIHDHLGGGFARYSVDAYWLVPHFEKMLYDNAQLLELFALAYRQTGETLFDAAAAGIVSWLEREMLVPGGGFASSLDADSEGEEGRFYVWTPDQLKGALEPADADLFAAVYDVTPDGNWEGVSIPNLLKSDPALAEGERMASIRRTLLAAREARIRPGRDDKVLADWNGLMIAALARAGAMLERPAWVDLADRAFAFVVGEMAREDRLGHAFRAGQLVFPGFASDHGAMARAAVALAEARADLRYLDQARAWLNAADRIFLAADGIGYAVTASDAADLPIRPRSTLDDAMPNANALLAEAWLGLGTLAGEEAALRRADALLEALSGAMAQNVIGHASLLNVLDRRLRGAEVVVVGSGVTADALRRTALRHPFLDRLVLTVARVDALPEDHPVRGSTAGSPAAYVCAGQTCSLPITDPAALEQELVRRSASA